MYIKSLLIYDYIKNKANVFNFSKGINLFVSTTNKQGKSSLIKSIYYSLGFNIKIWPTNWDYKNMIFQLVISHNNKDFLITRHKDLFYINEKELVLSEKEFSLWLQELLELRIQIKSKQPKELSDVYSSEVLMPFYIDQDKSWSGYVFSKTSDSYARYSSATKDVFEFYFNINSIKKLELEISKSKYENEISLLNKQIDALNLLENTHQEEEPKSYIAHFLKSDEEVIETQLEIYISQLNKINQELLSLDLKILDIDKQIDILLRNNIELNTLKRNYNKRLKEIEYSCIYCNSNLTEEQSLKRLKIRNNIFEIDEVFNKNKIEIESLKLEKNNVLGNKQIFINKKEEITEILNTRNFKSVEHFIKNKVHQEVYNTFRTTEGKISNKKEKLLSKIEMINKEITKEKRLGKANRDDAKKEFNELLNRYEFELNTTPNNDINLNAIKFAEFKEVSGSGNDANIKMLALYTLYSNLITNRSSVILPFGMDSFLKNETSKEFKQTMFSFLSKNYLTLPTQIFFSIIEENLTFIDSKIMYHQINIEKPILKSLNSTNQSILNTLAFIQNPIE